MNMPEGYQIPDDPDNGRMDAAYLRTCLGMPTPLSGEPPPFPLAVRQAHYHLAHALSRLGAIGPRGMDATQLATVAALAAMAGDEEAGPRRTFCDDIDDGLVSEGQKIMLRYRGVEHPGKFLRVEGDKIIVQHEGVERKCQPTSVRLEEAAT